MRFTVVKMEMKNVPCQGNPDISAATQGQEHRLLYVESLPNGRGGTSVAGLQQH